MPSFFDFKHSSNWDGDIRSPAKRRKLASTWLLSVERLLNSETGIWPNSSSSAIAAVRVCQPKRLLYFCKLPLDLGLPVGFEQSLGDKREIAPCS